MSSVRESLTTAVAPSVETSIVADAREADVLRGLAVASEGRGAVVWWGEHGAGCSALLDVIAARLERLPDARRIVLRWGRREAATVSADARVSALVAEVMETPDALSAEVAEEWEFVLAGRVLLLIADDLDELPPGAGDTLLDRVGRDLGVVLLAAASRPLGERRLPRGVQVHPLPPLDAVGAIRVLASAGCPPVAP
ncbi:MAG: hypothetical protein ACK5IM_01875, partial [Demequina sp.]|uniref:hypothetical protein n=1 Tax=Demequina sp. TaxID=2050685 RepID=UPI003A879F69